MNAEAFINQSSTVGLQSRKSTVAKFLLIIKEECKLTQASIVSSMRWLWSQAMDELRQRLVITDESVLEISIFDGLTTTL